MKTLFVRKGRRIKKMKDQTACSEGAKNLLQKKTQRRKGLAVAS